MKKYLANKTDFDAEKLEKMIDSDCKNEEIKENGFKVSFGIAIIIVGFLSIFYDTGNAILVGISISSLIFSSIDAMPNRNNLLYILPLSLLLIFCIFPDASFIKPLYDERFNNFIVFFSFGATFIINSYTSFTERNNKSLQKLQMDIKNSKITKSQYINSSIILDSIIKIREICETDDISSDELDYELDELLKYAKEEIILSSVREELTRLGIKNNCSEFSLDDIERIVAEKSHFTRSKIKEKMNDFYEAHPEFKKKK